MMGVGAASSLAGGVVGAKGAQAGAAEAQRGAEVAAQGALFTGQANRDANYFNAGQMDFAALIDERDRKIALDQTAADARDLGRKFVAQRGQIRAAYGYSGLSIEGSPLDVLEATAAEQQLDVRKTLYNGEVVAAGLTDQAAQNRARASLLRYQADYAIYAGEIGADSAHEAAKYQSASAILGGFTGALKAGSNFMMPSGGGGGGGRA
jgi:hypothetical protein